MPPIIPQHLPIILKQILHNGVIYWPIDIEIISNMHVFWVEQEIVNPGCIKCILFNEIVYIQLLVSINVKWILSSSLIVLKQNGTLEGIGLLVSTHDETSSYNN